MVLHSRCPAAHVLCLPRSLNSVLDVNNGILYLAVSVPDPRKGQTTVVTVLQDAAGVHDRHVHR